MMTANSQIPVCQTINHKLYMLYRISIYWPYIGHRYIGIRYMKDHGFTNEMRKGFLKMFILKIIEQKPIHGYDIIHEIVEKTHGNWEPSPGSVYPALDFLQTKGYISMEETDRKKVYSITPEGREAVRYIEKRRQEMLQEFNNLFGDLPETKP